jgi:selenocysteine lyase/cysteine desulfurase
MNYVANGLDLKEGDELINTNQEHGGGFAAWQLLAKRRGCIYKQATMPVPANDPQEIIDAIFVQVTSKTRVIAIPHIVSVYGVVMPVKAICAEARKRGIFTILDGAQAVGQVKVDVKDIGCDAYYTSLHKWFLAPGGSGLLYIRKERMPEIWSTIASYNWENENDHGFRLMQNGTGNTALLAGLNASIDFYEAVGEDRWLARILELGNRLRDGLVEMDHITIFSPTTQGMCAGITTYIAEGFTGPELQKHLWTEARLQPRSVGKDYLRHSVHIYNQESEIDRTLELLRTL